MSKQFKGALFIALSTLGSGSMSIFAKLAYSAGADVLTVLLVRFSIATLLLLAVCLFSRVSLRLEPKKALTFLGLGALGYGSMAYLFFSALNYLSASVTALILYSYPAIVFCLSLLSKQESFTRLKLVSLLLSLGGVLLVMGGASGQLNTLGITLVLAAALLYSLYIVIGKPVMQDISPLAATTYIVFGATLFNLLWAGFAGSIVWPLSLPAWGAIICIAVFSTVLTLIFFLAGLKEVGASGAAIISTVEPFVTISLSAAVLGEALSAKQLLGGVIIALGIIVLQFPKKLSVQNSNALRKDL